MVLQHRPPRSYKSPAAAAGSAAPCLAPLLPAGSPQPSARRGAASAAFPPSCLLLVGEGRKSQARAARAAATRPCRDGRLPRPGGPAEVALPAAVKYPPVPPPQRSPEPPPGAAVSRDPALGRELRVLRFFPISSPPSQPVLPTHRPWYAGRAPSSPLPRCPGPGRGSRCSSRGGRQRPHRPPPSRPPSPGAAQPDVGRLHERNKFTEMSSDLMAGGLERGKKKSQAAGSSSARGRERGQWLLMPNGSGAEGPGREESCWRGLEHDWCLRGVVACRTPPPRWGESPRRRGWRGTSREL